MNTKIMKLNQFTISLILLSLQHCTSASVVANKEEKHRYMIKLKNKQSFEQATFSLQSTHDPRLVMTLPDDNIEVMTLATQEELSFWENRDDVEYVEPDSKVYLQQTIAESDEEIPWGIERVKALSVSDDNISNQKVCIIDSGYSIDHPDLPSSSNIVSGKSQVPNESWDKDGDGHGTHVAGTIAAIGNNEIGVMGVVRNGQLKLHIVKVFDNNGEWTWKSDLIKAVEECVNAGSTVINMSLGNDIYSQTENDLYEKIYNEKNVLLVAAAGNSGRNKKLYPASYPSVMSVGAVDVNEERAWFSQYNDEVDITAPGVDILSTFQRKWYKRLDGTSMSSPHVAGVAALVWSHFPSASAQEVRNALQSTAKDLGESGRDDEYGHGLIRASHAYNFLAGEEVIIIEEVDDDDDDDGIKCEDSPKNWYDNDGPKFDCVWYSRKNRCKRYGDMFSNLGKTANQACCVCGGGTR